MLLAASQLAVRVKLPLRRYLTPWLELYCGVLAILTALLFIGIVKLVAT